MPPLGRSESIADAPQPDDYGGGRRLPVHAEVEEPTADLASGLLVRIHVALLGMRDGQILRISSRRSDLVDQLRTFEGASGHALLAAATDPERAGWWSYHLRKGRPRTDWAEPRVPGIDGPDDTDPVAARMPTRLWLYTNYDCNLACDYCCVMSSPRADPRRLPAERVRSLVDEALEVGLREVFITGGEPTIRPDLPELITYVTDRLPLTLLTNAMLLRGPRWDRLRPLVEALRPVTFQVSLDSASAERHDRHRGRGAHAAALAGIHTLLDAGGRVRLAASLPEEALDEMPRLHRLADSLGIRAEDRIFRPIALRGASDEGEAIRPRDVAPEPTCDAQGWLWHPISNDPDMRLGLPAEASLTAVLASIHARLTHIVASGSATLDRFVCG